MRILIATCLAGLLLALAACPQEIKPVEDGKDMADIKARLAKYAQVEVSSDLPDLTPAQNQVLGKLIEAARLMDLAFWKQADKDGPALRETLRVSSAELDKLRLHFLEINKGRFDRQAENEPFIGDEPKPAGAAFWPEDLTREELESYVEAHPEQRDELYSLTTVVRREGEGLRAIPYHEFYAEYLEPAAKLLREAAALSDHEGFKRYLELRAEALVADDYFESDMAWMDLRDNRLDIVIGAIEPYEDGLMNLKGSYGAFVLARDEAAGRELDAYIRAMDDMQKALPVDERFKRRAVMLGSSVGVFTLVFCAGDGEAGIKTIAISLPNDERVREAKGTRKIMLRNAIGAKFDKILMPIAERLLAAEQLPLVDSDIFFSNILLHEIAHSLGNDFVLDENGERTETKIDVALRNHSTAVEECKADIGGLYSADVLIAAGVLPEGKRESIAATFLAGIFRSVRFGATSAHGMANAIELNWLLEKGGIILDRDGRWRVAPEKFASAVESLLSELLTIQYLGDYQRAEELVGKYATLPDGLTKSLAGMSDIPVDIEFVWR